MAAYSPRLEALEERTLLAVDPFPTPLQPLHPFGSLVFEGATEGDFSEASETDSYSLSLDVGQRVTLRLDPQDTSIRGRVEVLDPDGTSLGTATADGSGQSVTLSNVLTTSAGTYQLDLSNLEGLGAYQVTLLLNAGFEQEVGQGGNDSHESAESLEGTSVPLVGSADRLAIVGELTGEDVDVYQFSLSAGQPASLAVTTVGTSATLELLSGDGTLLARGIGDASNHGELILDYVSESGGAYFTRVTGGSEGSDDQYSLVVTRGASLEFESNDRFEDAQDIGVSGQVLGALPSNFGNVNSSATTGVIRVAVHDGGYAAPVVNQLNDNTYFNFEAVAVNSAGLSSVEQLMAYDVVVMGDPYSNISTQAAAAIRAWNEAGLGGVVGTSWLMCNVTNCFASVPSLTDLNAVVPLDMLGTRVSVSTVTIVDATHPVTQGLPSSFSMGGGADGSSLGVDSGAIVLATNGVNGSPTVAVSEENGRNVWLGPAYFWTYTATRSGVLDQLFEQGVAWAAGGVDRADYYQFAAAPGDTLTLSTETPGGGLGQPDNTLSPIIELYDPDGTLVTSNHGGAGDGKNSVVNYTVPVSGGGIYRARVAPVTGEGDYVLALSGATGATAKTLEVVGSSLADGAAVATYPSTIELQFSSTLLLTSVDADDLTVNGEPASNVAIVDGRTLSFDVASLHEQDGLYEVLLPAGLLVDLQGNASEPFTFSFTLDTQGPAVIGSTLHEGDVISPGELYWGIEFNEPLSTDGLSENDITLVELFTGQIIWPNGFSYDAELNRLELEFPELWDGSYVLTLHSGADGFRDLLGNPLQGSPSFPLPSGQGNPSGADFEVFFFVDTDEVEFPEFLELVQPSAANIHQGWTQSAFHADADIDSFTLELASGQSLSMLLTPHESSTRVAVRLRDPAGNVLAYAEGDIHGEPALLQSVPVAESGVYRIDAISLEGAGQYDLGLLLNSSWEAEYVFGDSNDDHSESQDLNISAIPLSFGADRLTAMGTIGGGADASDVYRFSLDAGQAASIVMSSNWGSYIDLELLDIDGSTVLARGARDAYNVDASILDFVAPQSGTYFARLVSNDWLDGYGLSIVRGATFGVHSDEDQPLGITGLATGYFDWAFGDTHHYQIEVESGDALTIRTTTPGDDGGQPNNDSLDLAIELYDNSGQLVASNDNGSDDGRNALLIHTVTGEAGSYRVVVRGVNGNPGAYALQVEGSTGDRPFQVVETFPVADAQLPGFPGIYQVTFDSAFLLTSLDADDLLINGIPASEVTVVDPFTVQFDISGAEAGEGVYTITLSEGTLSSLSGKPLAAFDTKFTVDTQPPTVLDASISDGGVVEVGEVALTFQFSEPMGTLDLGPEDVVLYESLRGEYLSPIGFFYDESLDQLTVVYEDLPEGNYTITLISGVEAFRDAGGTPLDGNGDGFASDFVLEFFADVSSADFPVPLPRQAPPGSLVHEQSITGYFHAEGDVDSFTLDLDGNQTISLVLTPANAEVRGRLALFDPEDNLLGVVDAPEPGEILLLQSLAVTEPGVYRVEVTSLEGAGTYETRLILNAAVQGASLGDSPNDTPQTAQGLDATAFELMESADRLAVLGRTGDFDAFFRFSLDANQYASIVLAQHASAAGDWELTLFDSSGQMLAVGSGPNFNAERVISKFRSKDGGEFVVRVSGPADRDYSLVVTRGAAFEVEANDTLGTAFSMAGPLVVLGDVGSVGGGINADFSDGAGGLNLDGFTATGLWHVTTACGGNLPGHSAPEIAYFGIDGSCNFNAGRVAGTLTSGPLLLASADPLLEFSYRLQSESGLTYDRAEVRVSVNGGPFQTVATKATHFAQTLAWTPVSIDLSPFSGQSVQIQFWFDSIDSVANTGLGWQIDDVYLQGADVDDYHSFRVEAGDTITLETRTPGSGPFEFQNTLEPSLELYDPTGNLVASNSHGAPDGINALLSHEAVLSGTYTVRVQAAVGEGAYVLKATGVSAEPAALTIVATDPPDGALLNFFPTSYVVTFSEPVLLSSVSPSDLTVDGLAADGVTVIDAHTLQFDISAAITGDGLYTAAMVEGAILSLSGLPLEAFSATFDSDLTNPSVVFSSLDNGDVVPPGTLVYQVQFSEELAVDGLGPDDVLLMESLSGLEYVADEFDYDPATSVATLTFAHLPEGNYTLTLLTSLTGFRDRRDNLLEGGDFVIDFQVDVVEESFAAPFVPITPVGSLIYQGTLNGVLNEPGDEDAYRVVLEPGQVASLRMIPGDASIRGRLEWRGPDGTTLGSVEAAEAGDMVVLSTIPVHEGGVYTLVVTALAGLGDYEVKLLLNAAWEAESVGGIPNSTLETAESLQLTEVALPSTGSRMAILGTSTGDHDYYSFTLEAGQVASLLLSETGGGIAELELLNASGEVLALGVRGASNIGAQIRQYRSEEGGEYFVRVSAPSGNAYSLVAVVDAEFDTESNQPSTAAQPLGGVELALGYLGRQFRELNDDLISVLWVGPGTTTWNDGSFAVTRVTVAQFSSMDLTDFDAIFVDRSAGGLSTLQGRATEIASYVEAGGGLITELGGNGNFSWVPHGNQLGWVNQSNNAILITSLGQQHPVTEDLTSAGLSNWFDSQHNYFSATAGLEALATDSAGRPNLLAGEYGQGRVLYLGLDPSNHQFSGEAQPLIRAALRWAGERFDREDFYRIAAQPGDILEIITTTPFGDPGEPTNLLDPRLELFNEAGFLVATDDDSAADQRNARILYTVPADGGGEYTLRVHGEGSGPYTVRVLGASETAEPALHVVSTLPAEAQPFGSPPTSIELVFSKQVRFDSVQAEDLQLDGGAIVTGIELLDGQTVRFLIEVPDDEAVITYSLASGVLLDLQGEGNLEYQGSFQIDKTGPRVVSQVPALQASAPFQSLSFVFDEWLDPTSFSVGDIQSFTAPGGLNLIGQIIGVSVDGAVATVSFNAQVAHGTYTMVLGPQILDLAGNPMDQNGNGVPGESSDFYTATVNLQSPDLRVEALTIPTTAAFGTPFDISWIVQNIGSDPAAEGWSDRVYLSTNTTLGPDDIPLATVASPQVPLGPGQQYTQTATIVLPLETALVPGNYYLLVVTDALAQQPETNENNNVRVSDAIEVVLPPLPDLVVSSISAPVEAFSGQQIQISWTLTNQGDADAEGTWTDRLFLSTDDQPGGDQFFGGFGFTGVLAAGQSIVRTQTINLPINMQGNRWVVVQTDVHNQIFEHVNQNNNTTVSAAPINVRLSPFPNLQVSSVTPPSTAFSGQQTVVEWIVSNVGEGSTSAPLWYDSVYLSSTPELGQEAIFLGNATNASYLGAGESYVNSLAVTLPQGISGEYYFLVYTDRYNYVNEFENEHDNVTASPVVAVQLTPPPDLQVEVVTGPFQAFSGQPMTLNWTVVNAGTGNTRATVWHDRVYLSTDATLDGSDQLLGTFRRDGALGPGESYSTSRTVTLPVGIDGDYFFIVQTDALNQVYEHIFELNNVRSTELPVRVNLTPPPDLEVEWVDAPSMVRAGTPLAVRARVVNYGSTPTPNNSWQDRLYVSTEEAFDIATATLIGTRNRSGALGVGDAYEMTITGTVPNSLQGNLYAFVITDFHQAVFELDTSNNIGRSPETIAVQSLPADLVVTDTQAPTTADSGGAILVNWTVSNVGIGDTIVTSWTDRVVLEAADGGAFITLANRVHTGVLGVEQSYTVTNQLVQIPISVQPGNYFLRIITDVNGQVFEGSNEGNNLGARVPIAIARQTPDLTVTNVSPSEVAVASGQPLTVSWTVENLGSVATNATWWYDDVYLSPQTTLGEGAMFLGRVQRTNALAGFGQYTATRSFDVPIDVNGDFHVIVRTDATRRTVDDNPQNNDGATATTVAVSLSAVPDLAVTHVVAPTEAFSGQTVELSWTVQNVGSAPTNDLWYDAVYLSLDQVLDRSDDIYLGFRDRPQNLSPGTSYTQTATFTVPRGLSGPFFVFVASDSSNRVYERGAELNNVRFAPLSMQVNLLPPADLAVGIITIPENAVPGQNVTVTYTVENIGTDPALGRWTDSLYISSDTTWGLNDPLLGRVAVNGPLAGGSSYTRTLTAPLPGVAPGDYHVIVRSDVFNQVPETDVANNVAASLDQAAIDVEELTLGTPETGTLRQGQAIFYKVELTAGQTIRFQFDSDSSQTATELYIRHAQLPTRGQFDATTDEPYQANPEILFPVTETGTHYLLAYGTSAQGAVGYTLEAEVVPFSVFSVADAQIGNVGPVTLRVRGALFTDDTQFELVHPSGATISADRVFVQDSITAFPTFPLQDAAPGHYTLRAVRPGMQAALAEPLTVISGSGFRVLTLGEGPRTILQNRTYRFDLNYGNSGDADVMAPLLLLESSTGTPLGFSTNSMVGGPAMQVLGTSGDGPLDILRPGSLNTVSIFFRSGSIAVGVDVRIRDIDHTNTDAISDEQWNGIEQSVRPTDLSDEEWAPFWSNIRNRVRPVWGEYVRFLNRVSQLVAEPGTPVRDVRELFGRLYAQFPDYQASSSLSGTLRDSNTGEVLAGVELAAYRVEGDQVFLGGTAVTGNDGSFAIDYLIPGDYDLVIESSFAFDNDQDGSADSLPPSISLGTSDDVTGLEVYAYLVPDLFGHEEDSDPILFQDAMGTSHMIWARKGEIWHSHFDGTAWVGASAIPGAMGRDFKVTTSGNLFGEGVGGIVLTWATGTELNGSQVFYAVGKSGNGGYDWSLPVPVTNDDISDDSPTVLIGDDGQMVIVYRKMDESIQDDADLYYNQLAIETDELAFHSALQRLDQQLTEILELYEEMRASFEAQSGASFGFQYQFSNPGSQYKLLQHLARLEATIKVTGSYSQDCTITLGANGELELTFSSSLTRKQTFTGSAGYSGTWNSCGSKEDCYYKLNNAKLTGNVGGEIGFNTPLESIVARFPPNVGLPGTLLLSVLRKVGLLEANIGFKISGAIGGEGRWTQPEAPPVQMRLPDSGAFTATIGIGPYGNIKVPRLGYEGAISGNIQVNADVWPNPKLNSVAGSIKFSAVGPFGFVFEYTWDAFELNGLEQETFFAAADLPPEVGMSLSFDPYAFQGTGNTYFDGDNASVLANVDAELFPDGPPVMAKGPGGEILLAWTKNLNPDSGRDGSVVVVSTFANSQWSTPVEIPGSLGYSSDVSLIHDQHGNPLVIWAHADAGSIGASTTEEEYVAFLESTEIVYSTFQNGTWTTAMPLVEMSGADQATTVGVGANGEVISAWLNMGGDVPGLWTSVWDGTEWSQPQVVQEGPILGTPTVGQVGGNTTIFWTEDIHPDPDVVHRSIFYSSFSSGWSAPVLFAPALLAQQAIDAVEIPAVETAWQFAPQNASSFFGKPPEDCCQCEEIKEETQGRDEGCGFRTEYDEQTCTRTIIYTPCVVQPIDPNDILGPIGFGDENWITAEEVFEYTIRFENEPSATAPAQQVFITQQLDPDLDPRTFRLGDYGWSGQIYSAPANSPFLNQTIDLVDSNGYLVNVVATVDIAASEIQWTFSTIDPATGTLPLDPFQGFLPVNDDEGIGEGFVSYTIRARSTVTSGTVIDAQARIVFDTEEPIDTPPIFNTLDAEAPTSQVSALPNAVAESTFLVSWTGSDDAGGSGLAVWSIYVSENGGPFDVWLVNTTLTEALYVGEPGSSYAFYSRAGDNAGNREDAPETPDAQTTVLGAVGVVVTPLEELVTSEAGGAAEFSVVLTSIPTSDVVIAISSSDESEGTVSTSSLTFTPDNWNVPQIVVITGVDDDVDDGDVEYTIAVGPITSEDVDYAALEAVLLSVINVDNDTAGLIVTPTSGLVTTQDGTTAEFTVVLTSEPLADVLLAISSSNENAGVASTEALLFTSANWNLPQTVTITGMSAAVGYTIDVGPATTADPLYANLAVVPVSVTNTATATPGVVVNPTTGLVTSENGGAAQFSVVLTSQPSADVLIPVVSSNTDEGVVSTNQLVFTPANWNLPQTVTVTGVDDDDFDGDVAYAILLGPVSSADAAYDGLTLPQVEVVNLDNDEEPIVEPPTVLGTTVQPGMTQRSYVDWLEVAFVGELNLNAMIQDGTIVNAVTLMNMGVDADQDPNEVITLSAGQFQYSFDAETGISKLIWSLNGFGTGKLSLPNGFYQLRLHADVIADTEGVLLDGDGDSEPGGDYVFHFHRLLGDVNGDMVVNSNDMDIVLAAMGGRPGSSNWNPNADIDRDGVVSVRDRRDVQFALNTGITPSSDIGDTSSDAATTVLAVSGQLAQTWSTTAFASMSSAVDVDWFRFDVMASGTLLVEVSSLNSSELPRITLYERTAVGLPLQREDGGIGEARTTAVAGRQYFVRVDGGPGRDLTGLQYQLDIQLAQFDDYLPLIGVDLVHADFPFRGAGYAVAVIDTGIDYTHPDLAGRVILGPDFGDGDMDPMDTVGHGTHIAGLIAGNNPHAPGVAPDANVVALKITKDGSLNASVGAVQQALTWVLENHELYNIVAVNLSFGAGNFPKGTSLLGIESLYQQLIEQGVFIAVAAGNSYAQIASQPGLNILAASHAVAAVGAVWDSNAGPMVFSNGARDYSTDADRVVSFSQREAGLDLVAPGGDILNLQLESGLVVRHGTSMSTPLVAGAAVLVRQAADQLGISLTPQQLLKVLQESGVPVFDGDDEDDNVVNSNRYYARLDVAAALTWLQENGAELTTASSQFATAQFWSESLEVSAQMVTGVAGEAMEPTGQAMRERVSPQLLTTSRSFGRSLPLDSPRAGQFEPAKAASDIVMRTLPDSAGALFWDFEELSRVLPHRESVPPVVRFPKVGDKEKNVDDNRRGADVESKLENRSDRVRKLDDVDRSAMDDLFASSDSFWDELP